MTCGGSAAAAAGSTWRCCRVVCRLPPSSYGVNLKSQVVSLVIYQHVPIERCVQLIADLAGGAAPSAGFVHGMLARCAAVLDEVVALIKTAVITAAVAGFDETTIRCGPAGGKKYILSGSIETAVAYHLGGRDLGSFRAFGILPAFAGIAVHDRYARRQQLHHLHQAGQARRRSQHRCGHRLLARRHQPPPGTHCGTHRAAPPMPASTPGRPGSSRGVAAITPSAAPTISDRHAGAAQPCQAGQRQAPSPCRHQRHRLGEPPGLAAPPRPRRPRTCHTHNRASPSRDDQAPSPPAQQTYPHRLPRPARPTADAPGST